MKKQMVEISVEVEGGKYVRVLGHRDGGTCYVHVADFLSAVGGATLGAGNVVKYNNAAFFSKFNSPQTGQEAYYMEVALLMEDDFIISKRDNTHSPTLMKAISRELHKFVVEFDFKPVRVKNGSRFRVNGKKVYSSKKEVEVPAKTVQEPEVEEILPCIVDVTEHDAVLDDIVAKLDAINTKVDLINGDVNQLIEVVDAAELFHAIMRTYNVKIESKREE